MAVNKASLREFVMERGRTNRPATYREAGDALGFHWRDRTMCSTLRELSIESFDQYGILISAMIGRGPHNGHGEILPGEGFAEVSREVAGFEVTDIARYRQRIQQILRKHEN